MTVLREIGTGYAGKEPGEYVVDTLRSVVLLAGGEVGFEACLTSRPFTARTFVPDAPGLMVPGRSGATGAERVRLDLRDGLAVLGARHTAVPLAAGLSAVDGRRALIAGPLRVDDRWCPIADRISSGEAWRYVCVRERAGDDIICFDPVFAGYTRLPPDALADRCLLVEAPVDANVDAVARRCLAAGTGYRAREKAADRDGDGLLRCRDAAAELVAGAAGRRLRLSLRGQALQAMRWAALLGEVGPLGMDELALADLLRDAVLACGGAHRAVLHRDGAALASEFDRLAATAGAITEVCARIAGGTG